MENPDRVSIHIPATNDSPGGNLMYDLDAWQEFLTKCREYGGESFVSGTKTEQEVFTELLRTSGIPVEATAS